MKKFRVYAYNKQGRMLLETIVIVPDQSKECEIEKAIEAELAKFLRPHYTYDYIEEAL